jgi:hypothetical protein
MKIFMDSDPKVDYLKVNRQLKLLDWDGIEVVIIRYSRQ